MLKYSELIDWPILKTCCFVKNWTGLSRKMRLVGSSRMTEGIDVSRIPMSVGPSGMN